MPDSENMRTMIEGGSSFGGGSAGTNAVYKKLHQASTAVEMNLRYRRLCWSPRRLSKSVCSKIGNDERRTRVGYKTQHKKKAFELMDHMAANFNIHPLIIERAREE